MISPVGSFEQHGLATDTIVAAAIAETHHLWALPPLSFSCSHEHASFPGTLSISATTLAAVIADLAADVERQGAKLLIVNGHGGNSVLVNVVQEANVSHRRLLLYPTSADWAAARRVAGCVSTVHQDMHAGEAEASLLLHIAPEYLRAGWRTTIMRPTIGRCSPSSECRGTRQTGSSACHPMPQPRRGGCSWQRSQTESVGRWTNSASRKAPLCGSTPRSTSERTREAPTPILRARCSGATTGTYGASRCPGHEFSS